MERLGKVIDVKPNLAENYTTLILDTGKKLNVRGLREDLINTEIYRSPSGQYTFRREKVNLYQTISTSSRDRIGKMVGDTSTDSFTFEVYPGVKVYELDFVLARSPTGYILGQVTSLSMHERNRKLYGKVKCLAALTENGRVELPREPPIAGSQVFRAGEEEIKYFLRSQSGLYLGKLLGTDLKVYISIKELIDRNLVIFGVKRSGKSYTVRVLIEELVKKGLPVVVIDPHGEYNFKHENDTPEEVRLMDYFGISPMSFSSFNKIYSPEVEANPEVDEHIDPDLADDPHFVSSLVVPGQVTTINLRGASPDIACSIVGSLTEKLFELRKLNKIPPFFYALDEVHNYAPQDLRLVGAREAKYSLAQISRVASEGGKFGIGLMLVSQRPAWVSKSVIAPLSGYIITRVTARNDKTVVKSSVTGADDYMHIIERLQTDTVYVSGLTTFPVLVRVRVSHTKHFGASVNVSNILSTY